MPVSAQTPPGPGCDGHLLPTSVAPKAALNILACGDEGNLGRLLKSQGYLRHFTYFSRLFVQSISIFDRVGNMEEAEKM